MIYYKFNNNYRFKKTFLVFRLKLQRDALNHVDNVKAYATTGIISHYMTNRLIELNEKMASSFGYARVNHWRDRIEVKVQANDEILPKVIPLVASIIDLEEAGTDLEGATQAAFNMVKSILTPKPTITRAFVKILNLKT